MGNLFCSAATVPSLLPPPPHGTERMTPALVPGAEVSLILSSRPLSRTRGQTASKSESTHLNGMFSQGSNLQSSMKSTPQPPRSSTSSSLQSTRTMVQSVAVPKGSNRSDFRPTSSEHSKSGVGASTTSCSSRRALNSTVKQALADNPEFRILVVGKRGSGKSSLINAAFGVDMSLAAGPAAASGVDFEFRPDDNRRLIVHECSGLEPGDAPGLRAILNFISNRTDPSCTISERLHAIWICVPTFDAIHWSIGEGVEDILRTRKVPVIVAFTQSDLALPQIWCGDRTARFRACEQLCRPVFRREPRDVPAVLVSAMPQFGALIDDLIVTTDEFIMGLRTVPTASALSSSRGAMSRTDPVPLVWSVALRASPDITIRASIGIGQRRYWCNLWSSLNFTDQTLKNCLDAIHTEIVEIWNLYDRDGYLSSTQFKKNMFHVVKDLASPSDDRGGSGGESADWVNDVYERRSERNVRCVMGYIVTLTVILDDIVRRSAGNVMENAARMVLSTHIGSGRRDRLHRDIRSFVKFAFNSHVPQDLVSERIVDLIWRYRSPPFRQ